MAKGKKTGGKNFPEGVSGNPRGAQLHNPVVKKIRRLTQEEVHVIGSLVLSRNMEEIERIADDPKQPALRAWIAEVVASGKNGGNMVKLNALLDRLIGKVPDKLAVSVQSPHATKSREQIQAEIKELEELDAIKASKV